MKKLTVLFLIAGICSFTACGPSAEEEAVKTQATIDSVGQAEEEELERMAAEAQAELETQETDEDTAAAEEVNE